MAKFDNDGRPVYRISNATINGAELKAPTEFVFEQPDDGKGVTLDVDAINEQLASIVFVHKPDVTLTYGGHVRSWQAPDKDE